MSTGRNGLGRTFGGFSERKRKRRMCKKKEAGHLYRRPAWLSRYDLSSIPKNLTEFISIP